MARLIIEGFQDVNEAILAAKNIALHGNKTLVNNKVNMQNQPWIQIAYDGDVTIQVHKISTPKAGGSGPSKKGSRKLGTA